MSSTAAAAAAAAATSKTVDPPIQSTLYQRKGEGVEKERKRKE